MIGNHTRFLILPAVQGCRNLGSSGLGANLQCLSADWQAEWVHSLELAEGFGAPAGSRARCQSGELAGGGPEPGLCALERPIHGHAWATEDDTGGPLRPDARARLRHRSETFAKA